MEVVSLPISQADAGDSSVCQPKGHCEVLKKFIIAGVVAATATLGVAGIAYADTGSSGHRASPSASTSSADDSTDSDDADDNDATSGDDTDADDSSSDDNSDDDGSDTGDSNDGGSDTDSGGFLGL